MAADRRVCQTCLGHGYVVIASVVDPITNEIVQDVMECQTCQGWGRVPMFLVAPPSDTRLTRAVLRRLDDDAVWRLCWCGSARERRDAEKELRRRESR